MQSGDWSTGRTEVSRVERDLSLDSSARMQWELIGHEHVLHSVQVDFLPIIVDQNIKSDRHWLGVGRLSGVKVALKAVLVVSFHVPLC